MKQKKDWIFWTPRILSILFLCFLALFSLDIFGNGYGFWETIIGLFMHNIPIFVLAILLWISWKRELIGAITFILAGMLYVFLTLRTAIINGFEGYYLAWIAQVSGISFFIGVLFLINWKRKKKN